MIAATQQAFVDTDVIIRLVTGDDPAKQAAAVALFERVEAGDLSLSAPDTVIADAVYVLASPRLYGRPREEIKDILTTLIRLPGFAVAGKPTVLRALDLYEQTGVDFGDAMLVAAMAEAGERHLYAYDADFDRFALTRLEPEPPRSREAA